MTKTLSTQASNINWLMTKFVSDTPGVDQAIAVSSGRLLPQPVRPGRATASMTWRQACAARVKIILAIMSLTNPQDQLG